VRSLRVELTGTLAYWTVVDEDWVPVPAADAYLRYLRLGAGRAEGTTRTYAGDLACYLGWCEASGRDLVAGAKALAMFVAMVRTTPVVRAGSGQGRVRGPGRINHLLAAVREFYKHAVADGGMALAGLRAGTAERDTLVDRDVGAYLRGLPDHHAGGVVDEQAGAEPGRGVDLDTGQYPGQFRGQPREQPGVPVPEPAADPVAPDRVHAGIAQDDRQSRAGGRIPVHGRPDVMPQGCQHGYPASPANSAVLPVPRAIRSAKPHR